MFIISFGSLYRLACWVIISTDDILKYFSYFSQKTGFDITYILSPMALSPMEMICMKCQNLFSGKNKKTIINLLSG